MKTYRLTILFLFFGIGNISAQENELIHLYEEDIRRLNSRPIEKLDYIDYSFKTKNSVIDSKFSKEKFSFGLYFKEVITQDQFQNYKLQNIESLDNTRPYELHEWLSNNQQRLVLIVKNGRMSHDWGKQKFDYDKGYLIFTLNYKGTSMSQY